MSEITKGNRYQAKNPSAKVKKGVITRPMLFQFLAWLRKKGLGEDAAFAETCHLCGLRMSEALQILVGDVIDDDHDTKHNGTLKFLKMPSYITTQPTSSDAASSRW